MSRHNLVTKYDQTRWFFSDSIEEFLVDKITRVTFVRHLDFHIKGDSSKEATRFLHTVQDSRILYNLASILSAIVDWDNRVYGDIISDESNLALREL